MKALGIEALPTVPTETQLYIYVYINIYIYIREESVYRSLSSQLKLFRLDGFGFT